MIYNNMSYGIYLLSDKRNGKAKITIKNCHTKITYYIERGVLNG